jgi:hypothetical protein
MAGRRISLICEETLWVEGGGGRGGIAKACQALGTKKFEMRTPPPAKKIGLWSGEEWSGDFVGKLGWPWRRAAAEEGRTGGSGWGGERDEIKFTKASSSSKFKRGTVAVSRTRLLDHLEAGKSLRREMKGDRLSESEFLPS